MRRGRLCHAGVSARPAEKAHQPKRGRGRKHGPRPCLLRAAPPSAAGAKQAGGRGSGSRRRLRVRRPQRRRRSTRAPATLVGKEGRWEGRRLAEPSMRHEAQERAAQERPSSRARLNTSPCWALGFRRAAAAASAAAVAAAVRALASKRLNGMEAARTRARSRTGYTLRGKGRRQQVFEQCSTNARRWTPFGRPREGSTAKSTAKSFGSAGPGRGAAAEKAPADWDEVFVAADNGVEAVACTKASSLR